MLRQEGEAAEIALGAFPPLHRAEEWSDLSLGDALGLEGGSRQHEQPDVRPAPAGEADSAAAA